MTTDRDLEAGMEKKRAWKTEDADECRMFASIQSEEKENLINKQTNKWKTEESIINSVGL